MESIFKMLFFPSLFFINGMYVKFMIAIICLLGLFRNKGFIKFRTQWLFDIKGSEFLHTLFYVFVLSMPPGRHTMLFYFPVILFFMSGLSEYMIQTNHIVFRSVALLKNFFLYI